MPNKGLAGQGFGDGDMTLNAGSYAQAWRHTEAGWKRLDNAQIDSVFQVTPHNLEDG